MSKVAAVGATRETPRGLFGSNAFRNAEASQDFGLILVMDATAGRRRTSSMWRSLQTGAGKAENRGEVSQGGTIHLQEQRGPGAFAFAELPVVETIEQSVDGFVQLGDCEEPAVP
jgi:hypothetical protein